MNAYLPATTASVISFDYGDLPLRAIDRDGEPWFVAQDVCAALGYTNVSEALNKHVDADHRGLMKCETLGGVQRLNGINEVGLYSLVLKSHKPEAKPFQRWVTKEVLPSIRKHGAYAMGAENLPQAAQENLYRVFRAQVQEALRRHDRVTEHDHWVSLRKQQERSEAATRKVAQEMGLPLALVQTAAARGVDTAVKAVLGGKL